MYGGGWSRLEVGGTGYDKLPIVVFKHPIKSHVHLSVIQDPSIHIWNFHRDSTSESRLDHILMFCLFLDPLNFTSANALSSPI